MDIKYESIQEKEIHIGEDKKSSKRLRYKKWKENIKSEKYYVAFCKCSFHFFPCPFPFSLFWCFLFTFHYSAQNVSGKNEIQELNPTLPSKGRNVLPPYQLHREVKPKNSTCQWHDLNSKLSY